MVIQMYFLGSYVWSPFSEFETYLPKCDVFIQAKQKFGLYLSVTVLSAFMGRRFCNSNCSTCINEPICYGNFRFDF